MTLPWPWAKIEWRAVCAERCTYGSGRRSAAALLTPLATWQGFVYVAFVIDAFARRIIGWRASRTAHAGFVLDALDQAVHDRSPSIAAAASSIIPTGEFKADSTGRRNTPKQEVLMATGRR